MIGLDAVYVLLGVMFAAFAVSHALDRSWRSALFWGCFAVLVGAGSLLPDIANGLLVILLAVLAVMGLRPAPVATTDEQARTQCAAKLGNRLFLPALTIPAITLVGTFLLPLVKANGAPMVDPKQVTLISLAIGAVAGLAFTMVLLRAPITTAMREGRRLVDAIGWA